MKVPGSLKLYSFDKCPFAQRAWIGLLRGNVPFEYIEMNPYKNRENKVWKEIAPKQKGNEKTKLKLLAKNIRKYTVCVF
jgi:hypothetical protein